MLLNIINFEIQYRLKRPETYVLFFGLLIFSIFGVEFVFQGVELGMVKKNAPIVIAKTMGAICALSILIVSMVMGVPILRDFRYGIASIIYVNPLSKKEYLLGKFLGALIILLFIFSAVLWGMILGEFMPWVQAEEYLPFNLIHYLQPFLWVALPIVLFTAALFFVTGALSKSLFVVYTQGLVLFILFLLTKAIDHQFLRSILDPFSLNALSQINKSWTVAENNSMLIPWSGILLWKNMFWSFLGLIVLFFGHWNFQLKVLSSKKPKNNLSTITGISNEDLNKKLPNVKIAFDWQTSVVQLFYCTWFEVQYLLKQTLFWAIVLGGFVIILINAINLETTYYVSSYPTTYLIIEELQETSIYFFIFILLIYSGEIIWKEREIDLYLITDASPIKSTTRLVSKFFGLMVIDLILLLSLLLAGVIFQTSQSYFQYNWEVYFIEFFVVFFPFLAIYTMAAFFFQALTRHKFIGMIATILFFILNVIVVVFITDHVLLNFTGGFLATYSEMNRYGHFLQSYFWVKAYWFIFGLLLLILASIVMQRGMETKLRQRWQSGLTQIQKPLATFIGFCLVLILGIGSFIFYNTNVLNEYWTSNEKNNFRANYEKSLKDFEYFLQPKIVDVNLAIELYPSKRAYEVQGRYQLINSSDELIKAIHLQKQIATHVHLNDVRFDKSVILNNEYASFDYYIYQLNAPLLPGDSIQMSFTQTASPVGFENVDSDTDILDNGTFFNNEILPSLGYQRKYELKDEVIRKEYDLGQRNNRAQIDDQRELVNARSGSDSDGIFLEMTIGTEQPQTAITSGNLIRQWSTNNRNYFHYKTEQKIINFYSILSANYEIKKEQHIPAGNLEKKNVDLEIFHHKTHEYNLDRIMESMRYSLDYYSMQFGPFPFQQMRVMEFPRYHKFAQSFPNTVPFSEAIGFVMDINDEEDVDMVFFITAHELAHQWWGIQLEAANVLGRSFVLETLAQYSAMMVLKEKYPKEKMDQFLNQQYEDYTKGIRQQKKAEPALQFVDDEEHIYYEKGALNMYALQKHIGEDKVNLALKSFLQDWKTFNNPNRPNRYATSIDLIQYLKKATPKDLLYLVSELFEEVRDVDIDTLIESQ